MTSLTARALATLVLLVYILEELAMVSSFPKTMYWKPDGRVTATVYTNEKVGDGLPAKITNPALNEGEPYLAVIPDLDEWSDVAPELIPDQAPKEAVLVYFEDEETGNVYVQLRMNVEEAIANRRTPSYLGFKQVQLPQGTLDY